jgi:hypothetical protein
MGLKDNKLLEGCLGVWVLDFDFLYFSKNTVGFKVISEMFIDFPCRISVDFDYPMYDKFHHKLTYTGYFSITT